MSSLSSRWSHSPSSSLHSWPSNPQSSTWIHNTTINKTDEKVPPPNFFSLRGLITFHCTCLKSIQTKVEKQHTVPTSMRIIWLLFFSNLPHLPHLLVMANMYPTNACVLVTRLHAHSSLTHLLSVVFLLATASAASTKICTWVSKNKEIQSYHTYVTTHWSTAIGYIEKYHTATGHAQFSRCFSRFFICTRK